MNCTNLVSVHIKEVEDSCEVILSLAPAEQVEQDHHVCHGCNTRVDDGDTRMSIGTPFNPLQPPAEPPSLLLDPLNQNCKQLVMYMNNWDKGVALAICPCIFSAGEY